ncbi:hypothetical protein [Nonomuraea dietziae]|uniref:hypothetical protein n=1 Tax=Nonomuraea dietziae TaxID=65515 RepID=UPI0031DCF083
MKVGSASFFDSSAPPFLAPARAAALAPAGGQTGDRDAGDGESEETATGHG